MTPIEPQALTALRRTRLVAVIRAATPSAALAAAEAVVAGGLPIVEVTFTVPEAPRVIAELSRRSCLVVGAGTVLSREQARAALDAGARFIIAPNLSREVGEE